MFKTPLTYDDALKVQSDEAKAKRKAYFTWFFDPMAISKAEKERRIKLAECLCDEFIETLIVLYTFKEADGSIDAEKAKAMFNNNYLDALAEYFRSDYKGILDDAPNVIAPHIENFATDVTDTTARHLSEDRFFSEGRAILMAQDESLYTFDEEDFRYAIKSGKTKKEWIAIIDEKTRIAHFDVDGTVVPIDAYFLVGGELMMYPHDDNASMENICNCRCTLRYF